MAITVGFDAVWLRLDYIVINLLISIILGCYNLTNRDFVCFWSFLRNTWIFGVCLTQPLKRLYDNSMDTGHNQQKKMVLILNEGTKASHLLRLLPEIWVWMRKFARRFLGEVSTFKSRKEVNDKTRKWLSNSSFVDKFGLPAWTAFSFRAGRLFPFIPRQPLEKGLRHFLSDFFHPLHLLVASQLHLLELCLILLAQIQIN